MFLAGNFIELCDANAINNILFLHHVVQLLPYHAAIIAREIASNNYLS